MPDIFIDHDKPEAQVAQAGLDTDAVFRAALSAFSPDAGRRRRVKDRLDRVLVARGLAENRTQAQALVLAGKVFSGTRRLDKAGHAIGPGRAAGGARARPPLGLARRAEARARA